MDLIVKGGWVMVPILLGSVAAFALVLERLWFFWRIRLNTALFAEDVHALVDRGAVSEAASLCRSVPHPLGAVFLAALDHAEEDASAMERAMEREGQHQIQRLEKNLHYLVIVVGIEPLLGFLGTILGLIQAFMAWEKHSASVTVSTLAGGIYQAMLTTAAGLIVAIPYFVLYHLLASRVSSMVHELNHYGDGIAARLLKGKPHTRRA